ncbi:probable WRKY transcription factor protein 1 [Condylostylus longicornis]|uniref:probable WRKY transcription factor protein 1 n=1 Tax=Condylostylus longicornis TaxID=2530218 RepID=UPI00244DDF39|nr:probable WRKY transcription factor protein 1 [Condylostylus longicornis]
MMNDQSTIKNYSSPLPVPLTETSIKNDDEKNILSLKKFEGLQLDSKENVDADNEDYDDDAKPITKEEEWVTKKKTELTTTRQIETRVKRQVVLEDGKVVDDSGPMVSTNTTEDTDKKESETTERVNFGSPNSENNKTKEIDNEILQPIEDSKASLNKTRRKKWSKVEPGSSIVLKTDEVDDDGLVLTPRQEDGLVREIDNKHIVSHEEIEERLETEDVRHLGDFPDEVYVKAVNSGAQNLEDILYSEKNKLNIATTGPRIVHQSTKSHKIVDSEDINQKSLVKSDGTLITEKKKTTEHEEIFDKDSPDNDDSSYKNHADINTIESSQRFFKQRDEQNVEYVADDKVIAKEMRYAAETEQMERDGPHEGPHDWDSLSDRIRKTRRNHKTILQHQREAAILADRKDALTKRPLNFDREEETRKGETMKWLESHFGSESTASSDSRDGDHESDLIEPSKKTFFNVTIKSNHTLIGNNQNGYENYQQGANGKHSDGVLHFTSKVSVPEKNAVLANNKTKYFQGISNWSERRESNPKHFASKAFKDELQGTVEKNNLKHISREDLRIIKTIKTDDSNKRENFVEHKKQHYGSKGDLKYHRKSSGDDIDDPKIIRLQKHDFSYLGDLSKDGRCHKNVKDDRNLHSLLKINSRLKREDSGFVRDSREDVHITNLKDVENESFVDYKQPILQKDESTYMSSSNYLESPIKTSQLGTPDSGIRSPSSEPYDINMTFQSQRPSVPIRKRAIEKKLRQQPKPFISSQTRIHEKQRHHDEPPPDYSPPPRSRSISPAIHLHPEVTHQLSSGVEYADNHQLSNGVSIQTPRSRFSSNTPIFNQSVQNSNLSTPRPTVSTQTSPQPKQPTKVGQAIGNSFRKLVGKIRSASAERKLKMKSKSKSSERSPSPLLRNKSLPNESTYQQYNVIDSHIGETTNENSNGNNFGNNVRVNKTYSNKVLQNQPQRNSVNRESSFASSSVTQGLKDRRQNPNNREELDSLSPNNLDKNAAELYDNDISSPKQRYYLGEDPYGNSIFGKENKYKRNVEDPKYESKAALNGNHRRIGIITNGTEGQEIYSQRNAASTLGRYQKSNAKHLGSTPNLDYHSRVAQTLPRKLEHRPQHHSSTINVSIVNQLKPAYNSGPAKPARTYSKPILNRSKSFNVHGMNGTNDPSPIYLEKLTKNNYTGNIHKSNPHLNESGPQLKSPSIVNLISRSQKDLSRLNSNDDSENKYLNYISERQNMVKPTEEEMLQSVVHANNRIYKYSDGRNQHSLPVEPHSSVEFIKDTASILRRGSSSTEDFVDSYNYVSKNDKHINMGQNFSKANVPYKSIESSGNELTSSSRYRKDQFPNLQHNGEYKNPNSSGGTTIIEVKGGKLRK